MAVIDIDRHILSEMVQNSATIEKALPSIRKAIAAHDRNQALLTHLVNAVQNPDTGKGQEAPC